MPFGVKSLEKRQAELVQKLFPDGNHGMGINATRLVVKPASSASSISTICRQMKNNSFQ